MSPAGYSGTPLARKLGIKPGHRVGCYSDPGHFASLLDLPEGAVLESGPEEGPLDVAVVFVRSASELESQLESILVRLTREGGLWVAWPKGSSPLATELRGGDVRRIGLAAGVVDNKVCAIDEDWSGLRFVVRLEDR